MWQLSRAEQKRNLQAEYDARANEERVVIAGRLQQAQDLRFYQVIVRGHYVPQYQILLDNRVHNGKPGYFVITPLRISDSDVLVLINRGWVPQGATRADLPQVMPPAGMQSITGLATVPQQQGFHLGPAVFDSTSWSSVWQYLDWKHYREQVGQAVQPIVVLLDADKPGGYVREWRRLDAGIAVHQGYALQWFSLALALVAIYVFLTWRGANTSNNTENQ